MTASEKSVDAGSEHTQCINDCQFDVNHGGSNCAPSCNNAYNAKLEAIGAELNAFAPDLQVDDEGVADGSSFRRIAIRVPAPKHSLELFLSPDQRFLSEALLDTTISPTTERRRVARETELALRMDGSPVQGSGSAAVALVEFSDFQCPFCRRFTDVLDHLPDEDLQSVKVVFKHRPLAMHLWARRAALAAICASFQSNETFWRLERFLFANQDTITAINLEDKLVAFAEGAGEIDLVRLHKCLAEESAEKVLLRDEKLAELYHVDAIPTVFVNGVRSVGFRSSEELQAALHAAVAHSSSGRTSNRDSRTHLGSE